MTSLNKKAIVLKILGRIFGVIMMVVALFLIIISITFSFGEQSSAPNLFGYNIYIVKNGSFDQLKPNTAAFAQIVNPDEVFKNDIIIYKEFEGNTASLAKINNATLKDAVFSYDILTENGRKTTISQGQVMGKVTSYSNFLGLLISFAISPLGLLAIAILPCLAIILFEFIKFIYNKLPSPSVETVKKQEETPTYVPVEIQQKKKKESLGQGAYVQAKIEQQKILRKTSTPENSLPIKLNEPIKKAGTSGNTDAVIDNLSLSPKAVEFMKENAEAAARTIKTTKTSSPVKKGIKTPELSAPKVKKEASAPDLGDVFKEENDHRYDIDDILSGIEKKHQK